jgi:hypothetical protein
MRRSAFLVLVCAVAALPDLRAQSPVSQPAPRRVGATAAAPTLPVRRVVLYKNGIGYFEHVGRVRGTETIAIDFNSAQLNDVLQSLTTLDLGGGRIAGVSFNSEAPLAQRLGASALPAGQNASVTELLGALRGARLEVHSLAGSVNGRLLSVERRTRGKDQTEVDEITVVSDAGEIRSVELTPAVSVRLVERDLSAQVNNYLGLVASSRAQDRRRMTISTVGSGERDVLVSYISEVPLWKTTYRIVIPPAGRGTPQLQGWAIVDNTIGEDWDNVELSLVAGAPQSFIQPLSQPLYTQRPVVGISRTSVPAPQVHQETLTTKGSGLSGRVVDEFGGVLPGASVTAIDGQGRRFSTSTNASGQYEFQRLPPGAYRIVFNLAGFQGLTFERVDFNGGAASLQDAVLRISNVNESVSVSGASPRLAGPARVGGAGGGVTGGTAGGLAAAPSAPPPAAPMAVDRTEIQARLSDMQAAAEGQNLGDLFEYRVNGPITIRRNQSALVPILKANVGIERVSLWNERLGAARPLRSVWLTNSSGLTLDGGSFTVLDDATFAGEGLIEPLKPGEKRLLSYAVDLGVQVESRSGDDQQQLTRVRFDRGVAIQQSEQRTHKTYTIRNSDANARVVVIEHPIRPGWTLSKGLEPTEKSLGFYRFAVPVDSKGVASLTVEERRPTETRAMISKLTDDEVALFVRAAGGNARLTQAFEPIRAQKAVVAELQSQLAGRQGEIRRISDDQARVRENMKSLKGSADEQQLLKRYVSQLNRQEDRLAALRRESADLEDRLTQAIGELERMIDALALEVEVDQ